MGGENKILKLQIDLEKTGQGGADAKAELDGLKDEAKQSTTKIGDLGQAEKSAAKDAEEMAIKQREVGHILREVGNTLAPGAGRALSELKLGPLGAALALLAAFESLQKKIEDTNKEAEKLDDEEFAAHQKSVEDVQKAWDDARQKLIEYDIAVANAGQAKDPQAERLKQIQAVSAARSEAQLKELELEQKITLEWLKRNGASKEQLAAAEEKNRREIDAAKDAAANRGIADIQADIYTRQGNQNKLDQDSFHATASAAEAQDALDRATKDKAAANNPDMLKKLDKAATDAQAALAAAKAQPDMVQVPGEAAMLPNGQKSEDVKAAQAAVDAANADVTRNRAAQAAADEAVQKAQDEKTAADAAQKKADEAGIENKSRVTQETEEVKTKRAVQAETEQGQQKTNSETTANNALAADKSIADAVAHGRQVSGAAADRLMADAGQIAGHAVNLQTAAQIIENGANNIGLFMNQVKRLSDAFSKLNPAGLQDLERRIEALEGQSSNSLTYQSSG